MQRLFITFFIVGLLVISFFSGGSLTYFKYFPYQLIHHVHIGAVAWYELKIGGGEMEDESLAVANKAAPKIYLPKNLHSEVDNQWKQTQYTPGKAHEGYTLFCPQDRPIALLYDMAGKLVHNWSIPIRPEGTRVQRFEDAHIYPNGDLVGNYVYGDKLAFSDNVNVVKMLKLDKSSSLLWEFKDSTYFHHQINIDTSGRIHALINPIDEELPKGAEFLNTPFLHDHVVILSPEGRELKRISLLKAFANSPFSNILRSINAENFKGDYLHSNDAEPLSPEMAAAFPQFKPGFILFSLRNIDTLGVLDPETETVVWAKRGPWRRQHDPDFMPNGNIMVFDNTGAGPKKEISRIIEFDIKADKVVNMYGPEEGLTFFTAVRGMQQLLPNGNLLIGSSRQNKLMEWSKKDGFSWVLENPRFGVFTCMHRYEKDALPFLKEPK